MHGFFLRKIKKTLKYPFQKFLYKSNHKPNKIWVDKGSESCNRSMKSWLQDSDIEMCSTHNEGKSLAAEGFIRNLTNKTYRYLISTSKNGYINKLYDKINAYSNKYPSTIKMKPDDVKTSAYTDFEVENNDTEPKLKLAIL